MSTCASHCVKQCPTAAILPSAHQSHIIQLSTPWPSASFLCSDQLLKTNLAWAHQYHFSTFPGSQPHPVRPSRTLLDICSILFLQFCPLYLLIFVSSIHSNGTPLHVCHRKWLCSSPSLTDFESPFSPFLLSYTAGLLLYLNSSYEGTIIHKHFEQAVLRYTFFVLVTSDNNASRDHKGVFNPQLPL